MSYSRVISFDGYSLIDGDNAVYIREVDGWDMPVRKIDRDEKPRDDGYTVNDSRFTEKVITMKGEIYGTSPSHLRTVIDNLKTKLNSGEATLQLKESASDTALNFTATCSDAIFKRNGNMATLILTFKASDPPFGESASQTTVSDSSITSSPHTDSISISGSTKPKPVITITVNSETSMTKIELENTTTGHSIEVERAFSAGEVLEIDTENFTVEVDGSAVDYDGRFPEFDPGTNNYTLTITDGGAFNVDLQFAYYARYL